MMLVEKKIGNKSLVLIHGYTHFQFSVEVENQLVTVYIGQQSRVNKNLSIDKVKMQQTTLEQQYPHKVTQIKVHKDQFLYKVLKAIILLVLRCNSNSSKLNNKIHKILKLSILIS